MPSDSDRIVIDHVVMPNEYRGIPTFALRSGGGRRPLLMNRLGGRYEMSEEELVRKLGTYTDAGYAYNPNGLTYGDMNALLNESGNWFDDWEGYFALYMWDGMLDARNTPSMDLIFKHGDDKGLYQEVVGDGTSNYRPASLRELERAGVSHFFSPRAIKTVYPQRLSESMTKEASIGMIVRDGDPSSPPSDIFMADEYVLKRVDHILDTLEDLRYAIDELVEGEDELEHNFDSIEGANFYNRTARTKQLLGEAMNEMSMLATEEFNAEDPTRAEASDLGGPTAPGNAGVPADVGGDDLVPYDSPSAPPAGVFMNAESNVYESKPFRNTMLGIAFTISALTFWSTAGTAVKTYVVSVVDTYAPKLLEPQNKIIITTLALVGIVYFGSQLRSENKPLTIPRMIDLTVSSATDD